jgi:hypothetical protein
MMTAYIAGSAGQFSLRAAVSPFSQSHGVVKGEADVRSRWEINISA